MRRTLILGSVLAILYLTALFLIFLLTSRDVMTKDEAGLYAMIAHVVFVVILAPTMAISIVEAVWKR